MTPEVLTKEAPPAKKPAAKRAAKPPTNAVDEHNAQMNAGQDEASTLTKEAAAAAAEHAEAMDALDPGAGDTIGWLDKEVDDLKEVRRWVVGKPPGEGGKESEYSVYVQQPLGWVARSRFFSVVSAAMSKAIRATGGEVAGMGDIFGEGGGTIRERAAKLTQRDFRDASQFAAIAMELSAYVPDLLLECYCIWLQVPNGERIWAKLVFEQPWDPEPTTSGVSRTRSTGSSSAPSWTRTTRSFGPFLRKTCQRSSGGSWSTRGRGRTASPNWTRRSRRTRLVRRRRRQARGHPPLACQTIRCDLCCHRQTPSP
jgi:hypothetical protein